jgi:enamine deaminase RidA (YjgF/YER057c/UK114 family)
MTLPTGLQGDSTMSGEIEARLAKLGLTLPPAPSAVANYVPFLISGDLLFVSGQIAKSADGIVTTGTVGKDVTIEQGQVAAKLCALNILAQAKAALGDLDRIVHVMRLTGFVNAGAGFSDHPKVINGASDLMVEVLGDKGRHTRAAVGASGLPSNTAVEIDAIIRFS